MKKNFAGIVILSDMAAEKDSAKTVHWSFVFVKKNEDENGNVNQRISPHTCCEPKAVCAVSLMSSIADAIRRLDNFIAVSHNGNWGTADQNHSTAEAANSSASLTEFGSRFSENDTPVWLSFFDRWTVPSHACAVCTSSKATSRRHTGRMRSTLFWSRKNLRTLQQL